MLRVEAIVFRKAEILSSLPIQFAPEFSAPMALIVRLVAISSTLMSIAFSLPGGRWTLYHVSGQKEGLNLDETFVQPPNSPMNSGDNYRPGARIAGWRLIRQEPFAMWDRGEVWFRRSERSGLAPR